ncbi:hypothetical protein GCM10008916_12760 [Clostridium nitritogenes]|uniref:PRC-barrel domain-containing protein n=1 Tax=Clostridium nitritogenes TaxID=83340 RepID=A0ABP3WXA2_9CLOT
MLNEIVSFLKESIGKGFRFVDINGGVEGIIEEVHIEEVHIEGEVLIINDININLGKYTVNKKLDKNLISFHSRDLGTALILIK